MEDRIFLLQIKMILFVEMHIFYNLEIMVSGTVFHRQRQESNWQTLTKDKGFPTDKDYWSTAKLRQTICWQPSTSLLEENYYGSTIHNSDQVNEMIKTSETKVQNLLLNNKCISNHSKCSKSAFFSSKSGMHVMTYTELNHLKSNTTRLNISCFYLFHQ